MGINDPRIPAAYPALDSAVFSAAGGPALDAMILDTIGQAHNRLQAAGSQMFSMMVPITNVTHGDLSVPSYTQPAASKWGLLVPRFTHRKKPGHTTADYRLEVQAPSGTDVEYQIATRRTPFVARTDTSLPQITRATGTGSWQSVEFDGVPVDPGVFEECAVYVRTDDFGAAHTAGTYGTPVSGSSLGLWPTQDALILQGALSSGWDDTTGNAPNDYGSRGFFVEISDASSNVLAYLRLARVEDSDNAFNDMVAFFREPIPAVLMAAIAIAPTTFSWKLYDPVRVSFAGVAGACADRSP